MANLEGCGRRNPISGTYRRYKQLSIEIRSIFCSIVQSRLSSRITTSANTLPGEFPWMVAVLETNGDGKVFICGGSHTCYVHMDSIVHR